MEEKKMSYEEWWKSIRKSTKGTEFKVRNCWGIYDIYKFIRKHRWYDIGRPLKEQEFYSIIRGINDLVAEEISNGETAKFPHNMGKIELCKFHVGVWIDKKGKLHNKYPIDWFSTMTLWYGDEEACRDKIIVRKEDEWRYHIRYNKMRAKYANKAFYMFYPNTFIKRKLRTNIKQGKVDTIYGKRNKVYKYKQSPR